MCSFVLCRHSGCVFCESQGRDAVGMSLNKPANTNNMITQYSPLSVVWQGLCGCAEPKAQQQRTVL